MRPLRIVPALALLAALLSPSRGAAQVCPADAPEPSLADVSSLVRYRAAPARVPKDVQDRVLMSLLGRVSEMSAARRADATQPKAVIQLDLDFTCFMPLEGQKKAFRKIGAKYDIPEFLAPEDLPVYPSQKKTAWINFLDETGLVAKYPNAPWAKIYTDFNSQSFVNLHDGTEELVPGLARFVKRVKARGGVVVFNTARSESTRATTEGVLRRGGIKNPIVIMKPAGSSVSTPKHKASVQPMILEKYGKTIAFIDDIGENRDAVLKALNDPDALGLPIGVPGFTNEEEWADFDAHPDRLSTYETLD